jgi:hypothetical protein
MQLNDQTDQIMTVISRKRVLLHCRRLSGDARRSTVGLREPAGGSYWENIGLLTKTIWPLADSSAKEVGGHLEQSISPAVYPL